MSDQGSDAGSNGCPHCPSRAACACPAGPERCAAGDCACDADVCPCATGGGGPFGCLTPPIIIVIVVIVVLAAAVALVLLRDDSDDGETSTAVTTEEGSTTSTAADSSTTSEAPPAFTPPSLTGELEDFPWEELGLGGNPFAETDCVTGPGAVSQTGGSPLEDPSLQIRSGCVARAAAGGPGGSPEGEYVVAVVRLLEPLGETTGITYQPGLGIARSDVPDPPPGEGEGIVTVPADLVFFDQDLDGLSAADAFQRPDFDPSNVQGWMWARQDSPFLAALVPSDRVAPGSQVWFQSFGRLTPAGATPSEADPAASVLAALGPLAGPDGFPPTPPGRFEVSGTGPGGALVVEEGDGGMFWIEDTSWDRVLKVLDGCGLEPFDSFWVFTGGLADVEWELTVTDTVSGEEKVYSTPELELGMPIQDTDAFATCPS